MVTVDRTHHCPGPKCVARCPHDKLACPKHWYQVPAHVRREVWLAWNAGDLDRHADAIRDAIGYMRP